MTTVEVRAARAADVDGMVDLLQALFTLERDFDFDPGKQRQGLHMLLGTPTARILVATEHTRIVGMITVQTLVSTAEGGIVGLVEDVVVAREREGRGIGGRMLGAIEAWGAEQGMTRLQLLTDRDNSGAIRFYGRRGWRDTSLVAMRRQLHPEREDSDGLRR